MWSGFCSNRYSSAFYPTYYNRTGSYYGIGLYDDYPVHVEQNTYNYYEDGPTDAPTSASTYYTGEAVGISGVSPAAPSARVYTHSRSAMQAFYGGHFDLARRTIVRAMLAQPEDPELMMLYGYAHFATGDYLVSSLAIRRALTIDPSLIDHPVDVFQLYGDPTMFETHVRGLDEFLATEAGDTDAQFLAGFVRYAAGQPEDARLYFDRCMEVSPEDLLHYVMRDAAIRAHLMQQAATRESAAAPIPESAPISPGQNELSPESF